ncbi:MAG TPA: hypothetical protein VJ729_14530 [Nitrososphaeraceae archaeon]|nr:hypothetical protein [Nitrososphaeraceae archaeon]
MAGDDKRWYKYRELFVVIPCYVTVAILAAGVIPSLTNQATSHTQSYTLSIGEDNTIYKIGDGKLTFTLQNNQGQSSSIFIYGLAISNNIRQAQAFVSDLYSQDGHSVRATNISIRPGTIILSGLSANPTKVDLAVQDSKDLGRFNGWFILLIGQDMISVPLSASTNPLILIAILWVTTGALISIGTWELGRFSDRRRTDNKYRILFGDHEKLSNAEDLTRVYYTKDNPLEAMSIKAKKIQQSNRLSNRAQATKFALVDLLSIVFGIGVFYIGVLSNTNVIGLQTISNFDIISLIGIGLGIGSLAGFGNK